MILRDFNRMIRFVVLILVFAITNCGNARNEEDSLNIVNNSFRVKSVVLPTIMIVSGGILSYTNFRKWPTEKLQYVNNGHRTDCDNYIQFTPHLIYTIGGELGLASKSSLVKRSMSLVNSSVLSFGVSRLIKHYTWEDRPGNSGTNSFPSGHTATAFTGAELARWEYGATVGIVSYCLASMVGILRLSNNKHWINDVIAGAGIGILSARIGVYITELEYKFLSKIFCHKNKSKKNKKETNILIIPHSGDNNESGICLGLYVTL